jgi:hypothetical protein
MQHDACRRPCSRSPSHAHALCPAQDAIRLEQFDKASTIKSNLDQLNALDSVAHAKQQLQEALKQERYADAAAFRDGGLTGLEGWWSSQHEEDPVGHLLHVSPEYSRWTGRMFRPRDLVEIKVG